VEQRALLSREYQRAMAFSFCHKPRHVIRFVQHELARYQQRFVPSAAATAIGA
jgi:hypothetical protein